MYNSQLYVQHYFELDYLPVVGSWVGRGVVVGVADSCVEVEGETKGTFGVEGTLDDDTVQIHVQTNVKCILNIMCFMTILEILL